MPNGHKERAEDIKRQIRQNQKRDWVYLGPTKDLVDGSDESPPDWVIDAARKRSIHRTIGKYDTFHGNTFVYKAEGTAHGAGLNVYQQLKSDYHETTPQEGTCPNCQSYVKRYDGDEYLTCHRCGWQYKPTSERLKNAVGRIKEWLYEF